MTDRTPIDQVGELAYLITGNIAATCCHKGGAFKTGNRLCECRAIAEDLIDDKAKVIEILNGTYEPRKLVSHGECAQKETKDGNL